MGGGCVAAQLAHTTCAARLPPARSVTYTPSDRPHTGHGVPLSPEQLTDFIRDGFVLIQPQVPGSDAFHQRMWENARRLHEQSDVGNNFLSKIPEMDSLLDSPEIVGALTSILGEDYLMTPSRHCHISQAGSAGQCLHQDDFFGFNNFRHAVPMEAMLMYYPQPVSELMGPTAVIPGSQYSRGAQLQGRWGPQGQHQDEKLLTLPKGGTCMLMHWHLWHRGTQQFGGTNVPVRYMFKLQFRRTRPLHPAPPLLAATCAGHDNPFLIKAALAQSGKADSQGGVQSGAAAVANYHDLTCASVWSALCGAPLPSSIGVLSGGSHEWDFGLAVACGVWPSPDALPKLVSTVVSTAEGLRTKESAASVQGGVEQQEQMRRALDPRLQDDASKDARCRAVAALQWLTLPDLDSYGLLLAKALAIALQSMPVHHWHSDWRLECLPALTALLPPSEALLQLVPMITPLQSARTQFHALMGIYKAGVLCDAPATQAWAAAAETVQLEDKLIQCASQWSAWGRSAGPPSDEESEAWNIRRMANDDAGARYALTEALRCIGRFCSPASAAWALHLSGGPALKLAADDPGWRQSFARFVERRRRCPITSADSPF